MNTKENQKNIEHYKNKLNSINELYNKKQLNVTYDRLQQEKQVDNELLYFKESKNETKGTFVFSFDCFLKELKNQEFKKYLSYNALNFKIYNTYLKLKKSKAKNADVNVNEIIEILSKEHQDYLNKPKILKRIFTLSYYLNWNIKKKNNSIDSDYSINIKSKFIQKIKQRFNLDIAILLKEDEEVLFFVNQKGDLNIVIKNLEYFNKDDIQKIVVPILQNEFKIKTIKIQE